MYASGKARPLEGLPIVVKCNIISKGNLSSAGTPALLNWRPKQDAPCVTKLREAGAVIVGSTNMPECAAGMTGWNPHLGMCRNPHEPTKTNTAGSSSGTASALAAGMTSAGLGSDTMGSLRLPAESCGIVGFKPSLGRWPSEGVFPLFGTHDSPGPMGATVSDLCLLDSVVCGYPMSDFKLCTGSDKPAMNKYKVGLPLDWLEGDLGEGNSKAIKLAEAKLRDCGASVKAEDFIKKIGDHGNTPNFMINRSNGADLDAFLKTHAPELNLDAKGLTAQTDRKIKMIY